MNFWMLKNMVDNLVSQYSCPFCSGKEISEQHIDIVGAAGNTVNIDMHCPACEKHFMVKTEVIQMELWNMDSAKLEQIQQSLMALKGKLGGNIDIEPSVGSPKAAKQSQKETQKIKEENILWLHKELKKDGFSAQDLFS
jgi:hypothetical protein